MALRVLHPISSGPPVALDRTSRERPAAGRFMRRGSFFSIVSER